MPPAQAVPPNQEAVWLIARKRESHETGGSPREPQLDALIEDELARAQPLPDRDRAAEHANLQAADAIFLELLERAPSD